MSTPHGPTPLDIGRRIRVRREALGFDQESVAERAHLSRPYISRLERGIVPNPKLMDLSQVAGALDMTLGALLAVPIPRGSDADLSGVLTDRFGPRIGSALIRLDRILALLEQDDTAALSVLVANTVQKYEGAGV